MFQPDLFSDPKPKFHVATEQSVVQVSDVLHAHFPDIGVPESRMHQSGAIEINSNNFMVRADGRGYIVKRWPSSAAPGKNTRNTQAALANWLAQMGVRLPAIRKPAASADPVIEHGPWCWCVLDYVEADYFSGDGNELLNVGIALHELFRVLRQAPVSLQAGHPIPPTTHLSLEMMKALERRQKNWPEIFFSESHAACLTTAWAGVMTTLEQILEIESELKLSIGLCHIDLHPHNVLMLNGKTAAFLDFHSLMQAPMGSIIAFNLFKLARQAIVARRGKAPDTDVRMQRDRVVTKLLAAGLLDQHAPDDLALLAKAEIMRRLLLILSSNFEKKNRDWNHVLPVQIMALQEADVVFS